MVHVDQNLCETTSKSLMPDLISRNKKSFTSQVEITKQIIIGDIIALFIELKESFHGFSESNLYYFLSKECGEQVYENLIISNDRSLKIGAYG